MILSPTSILPAVPPLALLVSVTLEIFGWIDERQARRRRAADRVGERDRDGVGAARGRRTRDAHRCPRRSTARQAGRSPTSCTRSCRPSRRASCCTRRRSRRSATMRVVIVGAVDDRDREALRDGRARRVGERDGDRRRPVLPVGVPVIAPVLELIESPAGRPVADQLYGVVPPDAGDRRVVRDAVFSRLRQRRRRDRRRRVDRPTCTPSSPASSPSCVVQRDGDRRRSRSRSACPRSHRCSR